MKDPHGKGPALILHAKRTFDSLGFAGKANLTETKNNNEKNKADARRCRRHASTILDGADNPERPDAPFIPLTFLASGDQARGRMDPISAYADSSGHSAEDACCACGGEQEEQAEHGRKASRHRSHRGGY